MSAIFYGRIREPLPDPIPFGLPRVGLQSVPGTDEAPIRDGVVFDGHTPRCCHKCGSCDVQAEFHRDIIDCLMLGGLQRGGAHLHWRCAHCGADFTTSCLPGTHSD